MEHKTITIGYITDCASDGVQFRILATFRQSGAYSDFMQAVRVSMVFLQAANPNLEIVALAREDCEADIYIEDINGVMIDLQGAL